MQFVRKLIFGRFCPDVKNFHRTLLITRTRPRTASGKIGHIFSLARRHKSMRCNMETSKIGPKTACWKIGHSFAFAAKHMHGGFTWQHSKLVQKQHIKKLAIASPLHAGTEPSPVVRKQHVKKSAIISPLQRSTCTVASHGSHNDWSEN